MRRTSFAVVAVATALAAGLTAPAPATASAREGAGRSAAEPLEDRLARHPRGSVPRPPAPVVPGVLLVTAETRSAAAEVRAQAHTAAPAARASALSRRVTRVDVPAGSESRAAAALATRPGVLAVERPHYRSLLAAPDDQRYSAQWAHQVANAEAAWDITTGSPGVTVAVLDNGVDGRHRDLVPNLVAQRVFANGSAYPVPVGTDNRQCDPEAGGDHGTHVAGIVGAQGDDGFGVAGVAWDVGLLDFSVFVPVDGGCAASDADVIAAVTAAGEAGVDVINMSLGGLSGACSTAFQAAISDVRQRGTVVVAAAGNTEQEAPGVPSVPASCNGVISVGAVGMEGVVAPYSTANEHVDLVAPGGDTRTFGGSVLSTVGDDGHAGLEGTSMASPYVAGVAALLRSIDASLTVDEVEGLLERPARDGGPAGRDPQYGWGVVDAGASVSLADLEERPLPEADPDFPVSDDSDSIEPPPGDEPQVFRVAASPTSTAPVPQAVAVSQATFADGGATHAVLARQDVFADALTGSSLGLGFGPLLFTSSNGPLAPRTRDELLRVLPPNATVYLLGGPAALPTTLEGELRDLGFAPVRLAGQRREGTAAAVSVELEQRRAAVELRSPGVVMLATGGNWPDAVTGGSFGAFYGIPVLVTPTTSLHPDAARELQRLRPGRLLVLGGPAAISEATYTAAATAAGTGRDRTRRVAGSDRYATAVAVASEFEAALARSGTSPACVIAVNLLRADGWAHVLSATPLAGAYGCVMTPVEGPTGHRLAPVAHAFLRGYGVDGVLAGGTDVVSDAAGDELLALLRE